MQASLLQELVRLGFVDMIGCMFSLELMVAGQIEHVSLSQSNVSVWCSSAQVPSALMSSGLLWLVERAP